MSSQNNQSIDNTNAPKRRAACDECRSKKLKCTGEVPVCSRCQREKIDCVYSLQKQMGRPKKRRKSNDENEQTGVEDSNAAPRQETAIPHDLDQNAWGQILVPRADDFSDDWAPAWGAAHMQLCPQQPWEQRLQEQRSMTSSTSNTNQNIPELTSESSNGSPPILNMSNDPFSNQSGMFDDLNIVPEPALTTDLSPKPEPPMPSCACLSSTYLTQATLTQMDPSVPFPFNLQPLRDAMQTSSEILHCQECPKKFITAIQNTQSLSGLLMVICECVAKVLEDISAEAERAAAANESKKFRLADLNAPASHTHTGGLGCVAAFSVDMTPAEWRNMCKKVVRAEMFGPADGKNCCPHLYGLLTSMERRQLAWHSHDGPADMPRSTHRIFRQTVPQEAQCLKIVHWSKKMLSEMDWS